MVNSPASDNTTTANHWDIFCVVVDNYGDIGVTWRLAKQLVDEYQIEINLWVDDLHSFAHILPQLDPNRIKQQFSGVNIIHWSKRSIIDFTPGALLIEAFACELPSIIINQLVALKQSNPPQVPLWINLEYLSAEDWVEGCHALPSLQSTGLKKYFYFPGFTPKTGGLICEANLLQQRDSWQQNPQHKLALFTQLGINNIAAEDYVMSLFSYETDSIGVLIDYFVQKTKTSHILVPQGKSLASIAKHLSCSVEELIKQRHFQLDNVHIHVLPMTDQHGYDRLLWSCDFNIVRGEDSFLRAQWAGKPFIWHIYPQEDDYHLIKLRAFIKIYCDNLAPEIANEWAELNLAFNQDDLTKVVEHWQSIDFQYLPLLEHAKKWPIDALNGADLASRLVRFVKNS
ncbi:elongation factor P maturation arginine rhamnosyltransferase EarP [Shewanella gaetbuli]